jgi:hypothetical protein
LGKPQDRGGNQLFYTKSQELHALWDTLPDRNEDRRRQVVVVTNERLSQA